MRLPPKEHPAQERAITGQHRYLLDHVVREMVARAKSRDLRLPEGERVADFAVRADLDFFIWLLTLPVTLVDNPGNYIEAHEASSLEMAEQVAYRVAMLTSGLGASGRASEPDPEPAVVEPDPEPVEVDDDRWETQRPPR